MGCVFSGYVVIYSSLFFGWKPSPGNWGAISTLLIQYVAAFTPDDIRPCGPGSLAAYQYVDDGAFVDPWLGLRPWIASAMWGRALYFCVGRNAVNLPKKLVGGNCETRLNLRGIEICTTTNTFALHTAKVDRVREFWSRWVWTMGRHVSHSSWCKN